MRLRAKFTVTQQRRAGDKFYPNTFNQDLLLLLLLFQLFKNSFFFSAYCVLTAPAAIVVPLSAAFVTPIPPTQVNGKKSF